MQTLKASPLWVNAKSYALILSLAVSVGLLSLWTQGAWALLIALLLASVTLAIIVVVRKQEGQRLAILFLIAFALRVMGAFVLYYISLQKGREGFYPFSVGGDDKFQYIIATMVASRLREGIPIEGEIFGGLYYPVLLGAFYVLVGPNLFAGQLLNAWIGALTVLPAYALTKYLSSSSSKAAVASLLVAFYPSHVFNSTQLMKDLLVVLIGLTAIFHIILLVQRFSIFSATSLFVGIIVLVLLRGYVAVSLALTLMIVFLFTIKLLQPRQVLSLVALILALGFLMSQLGLGFLGIAQGRAFLQSEFLVSFRETAYSIGGSSIGISMDYSHPLSFLKAFFLSFLYLILAPFPWQIRSTEWALAAAETLAWYALLPLVLKGSVIAISKPLHRPLLIFALGLLIAIALFSDNIGANTRLRMLPFICLSILAVCALRPLRLGERNFPRRVFHE